MTWQLTRLDRKKQCSFSRRQHIALTLKIILLSSQLVLCSVIVVLVVGKKGEVYVTPETNLNRSDVLWIITSFMLSLILITSILFPVYSLTLGSRINFGGSGNSSGAQTTTCFLPLSFPIAAFFILIFPFFHTHTTLSNRKCWTALENTEIKRKITGYPL